MYTSIADPQYTTSCPDPDLLRYREVSRCHGLQCIVAAHWFVATWIALAIVDLTLPSSRVSSPAIVHPPGAVFPSALSYFPCLAGRAHLLVTLSFSCAGCSPA